MFSVILFLQWACQTDTAVPPPKEAAPDVAVIDLPLLVEAQALSAAPAYQSLVGLASPVDNPTIILDTRAESAYLEGHIPGAISLNVDLTWNTQFLLISISEMEQLLGQAGLSQEHSIVIYDDGSFKNAARMFWILESHGHEDLHILNGGIAAWKANTLPVSTEKTHYKPNVFVAKIRPEHIATKLTVRQAIDDNRVALIDSRPEPEFNGLVSPLGRTGRIPSSINIEWSEMTAQNGTYSTLKSPEDLKMLFNSIPQDTEQVITYCNKGKQSAVTYLGLKTAGYSVAAYDGSWFEWSQDDNLPVE